MPRRKYGRLVKAVPPPPPPEKCRFCKNGIKCPVHGEGALQKALEEKERKKQEERKKRGKKGKNRHSKNYNRR